MKLTLANLRTIEAKSKKITKACREEKVSKKRYSYSKKAKAVVAAINKSSLCGSNGQDVKRILEVVMGEKLPSTFGGAKLAGFFKKHAVIVCTKNPNSHSYGSKPVLLLKSNTDYKHLRISGSRGNHLPDPLKIKSPMRYATDKEVAVFFKAIRQRIRDEKSVEYYR